MKIRTFGHPACVLLEGEPEDGDPLVRHGVEQGLHDPPREPRPLERVERDNLQQNYNLMYYVFK